MKTSSHRWYTVIYKSEKKYLLKLSFLKTVHFIVDQRKGILKLYNKRILSVRLERCLSDICLSDISDWMTTNMLKLNQDKTELIVFAPKHRIKHLSEFSLPFNRTIVNDVSCVKNLGVFMDKTLSMERVRAVTKSCFHQILNIDKIGPFITENACKTLVCSPVVTSWLDYGNALLYGVNNCILSKLQRVQNTTARLISRRKKHESITPVLISLHWLPVQYRGKYKILMYVFKALHGKAPRYLEELFLTIYQPTRALRSENQSLLKPPSDALTRTYGDRRLDTAAATLWNNLPNSLRNIQSVDSFKKDLKTLLFRQAYRDYL